MSDTVTLTAHPDDLRATTAVLTADRARRLGRGRRRPVRRRRHRSDAGAHRAGGRPTATVTLAADTTLAGTLTALYAALAEHDDAGPG